MRGLNSTAEAWGRSTPVDTGSIPVGSTIHEQRAAAHAWLDSQSRNWWACEASLHFRSILWLKRYLRHCAYWIPQKILQPNYS